LHNIIGATQTNNSAYPPRTHVVGAPSASPRQKKKTDQTKKHYKTIGRRSLEHIKPPSHYACTSLDTFKIHLAEAYMKQHIRRPTTPHAHHYADKLHVALHFAEKCK